VIEVKTDLSAEGLLERCFEVEDALGRVRTGVWAPRTIDLDLLLYGDVQISKPELTLPHPRMLERDFVILPLYDVAPGLVFAKTLVSELAATLRSEAITPLEERIWTDPQIRLIAALADDRVIGVNGHLPWSIPEDWELFLKKTRGGTLIMGRHSFEEMVKEPSWRDDRDYIVLTSQPERIQTKGISVVSDFDAAMNMATRSLRPVWVCGGAGIYERALDLADQFHLTRIDGAYAGDTYFPAWQHRFQRKVAALTSSENGQNYHFEVYEV
jgi:dihydrofolate reductase